MFLELQGFQFKLVGVQRDGRAKCETLNLDAFSGINLPKYEQDFEVLATRQSAYECLAPSKVEPYSAAGT